MAEWEARYGSGVEGTDRSPEMGVGGAREPADGLVELHLTGGVQASPSGVHLRVHTHTLACALPSLRCLLVDFLSVTGYTHHTHTDTHTHTRTHTHTHTTHTPYARKMLTFLSLTVNILEEISRLQAEVIFFLSLKSQHQNIFLQTILCECPSVNLLIFLISGRVQ